MAAKVTASGVEYTIGGKPVTKRAYNAYKQYKAAKATKNQQQIKDARYAYLHADDPVGNSSSISSTFSNLPWFVWAAVAFGGYMLLKKR